MIIIKKKPKTKTQPNSRMRSIYLKPAEMQTEFSEIPFPDFNGKRIRSFFPMHGNQIAEAVCFCRSQQFNLIHSDQNCTHFCKSLTSRQQWSLVLPQPLRPKLAVANTNSWYEVENCIPEKKPSKVITHVCQHIFLSGDYACPMHSAHWRSLDPLPRLTAW